MPDSQANSVRIRNIRDFTASLEIIFGDLPVKMTRTNEFVPVMKQNVPVIVPDCKNIGYKICNG
jgi:hypothetical protein